MVAGHKDLKAALIPGVMLIRAYKKAKKIPSLNMTVAGLAMFWLIASLIQLTLTLHCPRILNMTNTQTGLIMAGIAVSIAAGCWLSGWLSGDSVKRSLVTIGGAGLSMGMTLLYVFQPAGVWFAVLNFLSAFFAGLFKIPLNANIQTVVKGRLLGDMIAYNNLVLFIFIFLSAGIFSLFTFFFGHHATKLLFAFIAVLSWISTAILHVRFVKR